MAEKPIILPPAKDTFDGSILDYRAREMLKNHLTHRLSGHRKSNDGDKDPIETATLRGQIKELKSLLLKVDPPERPIIK
jgi:hypothetical protein